MKSLAISHICNPAICFSEENTENIDKQYANIRIHVLHAAVTVLWTLLMKSVNLCKAHATAND